jgi:hypothetical protein
MQRVRAILGGPFGSALVAALAVAAGELASLGPGALSLDLGGVVLSLHVALGLLIGVLLWLPESAARMWGTPPLAAALLRALPALSPLASLGRSLFQGASAASLPGASLAPIWLPAIGVIGLAGTIAAGRRILARPTRLRRALVAAPLLLLAALLELADRRLYTSQYPDLHAFLIPTITVLVAAAVRAQLAPSPPVPASRQRARIIAWFIVTAAVVLGSVLSLIGGLGRDESRWTIATRGSHGRHLVRVVRSWFDGDGDGFARVLGGGDCDDNNPHVNPGAAEVPGNQKDEDCDGVDLDLPPPEASVENYDQALAAFRATAAHGDLRASAAGWHFLLLSVDSLRADVMADSEANRRDFPNLFALLDRSRRFDRAFAPSAGTDLSVSGVLTGHINPFQPLDRTLLEAIRGTGRATHAVLPREVLRYAGRTLLTRGLDRHDVVVNDREVRDVSRTSSSAQTTRLGLAALDKLARGDRPFFLWLHYFDVHEHRQVENRDPALAKVARERGFDLTTPEGKYRGLLALVDRGIGEVARALEARGLAERTAILFFSDHGESLGEDQRLPDNHGLYVYQPLVHVPLAIQLPGATSGVDLAPVTLLDIAPTMLDLFGVEPWPGLAGRTLVPHLVDGAPGELLAAPRPISLNESDQWGVILWPKKLMVRPKDNLIELYDLERDPSERVDLAAREPGEVSRLKAIYQAFPPVELDRSRKAREKREQLARPPQRR